MVHPARKPIGLGPVALTLYRQPKIREEGKIDRRRPERGYGSTKTAVGHGHDRRADSAVPEIEIACIGAALPIAPVMCIVVVLERRGSAVDRNHAGTGPGPGSGIYKGCIRSYGGIVTVPRAKHMADFVHHRAEEPSLAHFFHALDVQTDDTGMWFPVNARPEALGTALAGRVSSEVGPGDVDHKAGAGLSFRPDTHLSPVSAVVSDQSTL